MNFIVVNRRTRCNLWTITVFTIGCLIPCALYILYDNAYPGRNLKEIILDEPCNKSLGNTIDENVQKIKSYPLQEAEKYLIDLVPSSNPDIIRKGSGAWNIELPAIVTAASSNHMHEAVVMLDKLNGLIRPSYPTIKVHFFDLGLTSDEKNKVQQLCNCEIHSFPFERFPSHVTRLHNYSWKPLIIAIMLRKYRFVMWMDSSIQFKTADLDSLFMKAKEKGVMAKYDGFLLASHTNEDTYTFLQETPCVFRDSREFSASLLLFHTGNAIIRDYFLKPWFGCALIEDCQQTKDKTMKLLWCRTHEHYHACHRYDQSVFGLLLYRLFSKSYMDFDIGSSIANWCRGNVCS